MLCFYHKEEPPDYPFIGQSGDLKIILRQIFFKCNYINNKNILQLQIHQLVLLITSELRLHH